MSTSLNKLLVLPVLCLTSLVLIGSNAFSQANGQASESPDRGARPAEVSSSANGDMKDVPPAVAKALEEMRQRIAQLEAELKSRPNAPAATPVSATTKPAEPQQLNIVSGQSVR